MHCYITIQLLKKNGIMDKFWLYTSGLSAYYVACHHDGRKPYQRALDLLCWSAGGFGCYVLFHTIKHNV